MFQNKQNAANNTLTREDWLSGFSAAVKDVVMKKKSIIAIGACTTLLISGIIIYSLHSQYKQRAYLPIIEISSYPVIIDNPNQVKQSKLLLEMRNEILSIYGIDDCFMITRYGEYSQTEDVNNVSSVDIKITLNDDGIFSNSLKQKVIEVVNSFFPDIIEEDIIITDITNNDDETPQA